MFTIHVCSRGKELSKKGCILVAYLSASMNSISFQLSIIITGLLLRQSMFIGSRYKSHHYQDPFLS